MKKSYAGKDLTDEKIVKEIDHYICKYLNDTNRGELCVKIYEGILQGKSQADIAKECNVNPSLISDYLTKIRKLIEVLKHFKINLEQFKKFEPRPHNFKEETLNKMDERRGIKRNRAQ